MGIFSRQNDAPASSTDNVIATESLADTTQEQTAEQAADTTATQEVDPTQAVDTTATQEAEAPTQTAEEPTQEATGDQVQTAEGTEQVPTNEVDTTVEQTADAAAVTEQSADAVVTIEQTGTYTTQEANADATQQDAAAEGNVEGARQEAETQVADTAATIDQSLVVEQNVASAQLGQLLVAPRSAATGSYAILSGVGAHAKLTRKSDDLRQSLRDANLVQNLSELAHESNLSAPMVAAFQAIPNFNQLVQSFPGADKFNVVIEHPTSANNVMGMESFDAAATTATDSMKAQATQVAAAFGDILSGLPTTITSLRAQIAEETQTLEASDITEEVLATLPVFSLDDQGFNQQLTLLESSIKNVEPYNADELQAHPDRVEAEVQGLQQLIQDVGPTLGLTVDQFGVREADRDAAFEPTQGSFGEKNLNASSINLLVSRAESVLDALQTISDRRDELVASVNQAIAETPTSLMGDDTTYSAVDHMTLTNSYTTFVSRLVSESVTAVAMVLQAVDSIVNIDTGEAQ